MDHEKKDLKGLESTKSSEMDTNNTLTNKSNLYQSVQMTHMNLLVQDSCEPLFHARFQETLVHGTPILFKCCLPIGDMNMQADCYRAVLPLAAALCAREQQLKVSYNSSGLRSHTLVASTVHQSLEHRNQRQQRQLRIDGCGIQVSHQLHDDSAHLAYFFVRHAYPVEQLRQHTMPPLVPDTEITIRPLGNF